jgi:transcriptional regulator with XRE-family HTH domain
MSARYFVFVAADRTERAFVEEVPAILKERGLSLRALAREAGVTDAHLSRLLRGVGYRTRPSTDLARRVALALGLPQDYFREYREAIVIEEVKRNVRLREELYERLRKAPRPKRA